MAQAFFRQFIRGDVSSAATLLHEKATYWVPGSHQPSGCFAGRDAVAGHLSAVLDLTNRTVNVLQWEDWMAGVTEVAGVVHLGVQRPGRAERFKAVFLLAVDEAGLITQMEMFFSDPDSAGRFFRRVD